jgi:HPt (histidine-containing phosphotransfer) domain-containing protein
VLTASDVPPAKREIRHEHGSDSYGEVIIDYRGALARLGGDESLFREFVRIFNEDAPGLLHTIQRCIHESDAGELLRVAHSLRGLAASVGAQVSVERTHRLECIANSHCLDGAGEVADDLQREVTRLIHALSAYGEGQIPEPEAPMP